MRELLPPDEPELLMPSEVAALFRVSRETVRRWAMTHQLDFVRTLGGHRRYRTRDVQAALNEGLTPIGTEG